MRKGSFRSDFVKAATLLILLPSIVLNLFVGLQTRDYVQQQVTAFTEGGLHYAQDDFGRLLDFVIFTRNQVIYQIVSSGILEHLADRSKYGIDLVRNTALAINMTDLNSPYVDGIKVFLGGAYKIASGSFSALSQGPLIEGAAVFSLDRNEFVTMTSGGPFRYVTELENLAARSPHPVIIELSIPTAVISRITHSASYVPSVRAMLVTETKAVLVESKESSGKPGAEGSESARANVPTDQELLASVRLQGQRLAWHKDGYSLLAEKVGRLPIYVVSAVPRSLVNAELVRVSLLVLIASLFVFLFSIGGAIIVAGRITRPLYSLLDSMDKVGHGDFSHRIAFTERRANEDVRRLSEDFNLMIDRIDVLVENLRLQEKEATLTQVIALQAQINPHFLYNTLDLIRGLASWKKIAKVDETAAALAELFRYSIDQPDEPVRLRDEVKALSNYLKIQQLRFEDRFRAVLSVDTGAGECLVPRLILQPVVENAFRHGLEPKTGPGEVTISACVKGGPAKKMLRIDVHDTGVGMNPFDVQTISQALDATELRHDTMLGSGVGLRNVHRRIRMSYGPPFGVTIESIDGRGTTITVLLPVLT